MKKVLFLNKFDDPARHGGIEVTLDHLARGIARRGLEPVILSTEASAGIQEISRDGVRIWRAASSSPYRLGHRAGDAIVRASWHLRDSYNTAMQTPLARILEIERPDIVSLHNLSGWSAAAWRTVFASGIPSVQVLHDYYAICPKVTMYRRNANCVRQCFRCRMLRLPHRKLSNLVSAVVGNSTFTLARHLDEGYFGKVQLRSVIHNARDRVALGVDSVRPRLDVQRHQVRVGYIGRLGAAKGIALLLETFAAMPRLAAELVVAGTGSVSFDASLRARFESSRVRFLGRVSPTEFYPAVDVVVVPSLWHEPLGMVAAEALAFGKPVIGARRGGLPEIVHDGQNGFLFEPNRPDDLARALTRIVEDHELRGRMSTSASLTGDAFVDSEKWIDRYLQVYADVLSKPIG
jgi:glycosyltransferase involved in cell wall biosynthesis